MMPVAGHYIFFKHPAWFDLIIQHQSSSGALTPDQDFPICLNGSKKKLG